MQELSYTQLLDLISVLSADEIRIVKQHLVAYEKKNRNFSPDNLLLFNCIYHNRFDCATTYKKFQKNNSIKNFRMLCYRLRDKILESFLLDVNLNRKGFTSKLGKIDMQTHKIMLQAKAVGAKGKSALALFLLEKVISRSKAYEIYPLLIEALHLKRRAHNLRFGSIRYKRITREIEYYQNCQNAIFTAMEFENHMQTDAAFKNSITNKLKAFVYYINKLKNLYAKYPSPKLHYHLLWLQMNYHQHNNRYKQSNGFCKKLLILINKYGYLFTSSKQSAIIANQAENAMFLNNFSDAHKHIAVAEQHFPKGSFNYTTLQITKFYAYYFNKEGDNALALSKELQSQAYRKTPFQQAMWSYYLAVCYFNNKEYKKAQALLNQVQELKRDKKGWNLSIRVLNICCSIEQEKYLLADEQLDRLRFYYYKKQGLGARNNAIIKSILWLEDDYNYSKVYQKASTEIENLVKNKGWYKWNASRTPELFFFHKWFLAKMNDVDYNWRV
jgi:hypothetical protein